MTEKRLEELIQKYAGKVATEIETEELLSWYRSNSVGEVPWVSQNVEEKEAVRQRMLQRIQREITPAKPKLVALPWIRIAALFILMMGAGILLWQYLDKPEYITVANPSGKVQLVALPDNSRVWLNASSTLQYEKNFTANRSLQLDGEAFFDVRRDPDHPFVIQTGTLQTTVLGTSFNVKAYRNELRTDVAVLTGTVKVTNEAKELGVLTATMQLQFNRQSEEVITAEIDTTAVAAWRKGKLLFDGMPLSDIAKALERWYGKKIIFNNPEIQSCRYYMSFDSSSSLEQILSAMAQVTNMTYSIDMNTVKLSGDSCQ